MNAASHKDIGAGNIKFAGNVSIACHEAIPKSTCLSEQVELNTIS